MKTLTRERWLPPIAVGVALWLVGIIRGGVSAVLEGTSPIDAALPSVPPLIFWLLVSPAVIWFGVQLPLTRRTWLRSILIHLVLAGIVAAAYAASMVFVFTRLWPLEHSAAVGPLASWSVRFQFGLFTYAMLLSWAYVHEYFTELRKREVALARLETELAEARLSALKAQLHPHFLFNTLHAITVLIRRDTEAATRMVMRLGDLLRMTLVDAERPEVPLEHELRFLRLYLEIEQTRFRERLSVVWDVQSGIEEAAVPPLILQPLVENAIKHGIESRAAGGEVRIAARREGERLTLEVTDNGPGVRPQPSPRPGNGIGLRATRARLDTMFPNAHELLIGDAAGGGTSVVVSIPWRLAAAEAHRNG